jgi:hypothetical protein
MTEVACKLRHGIWLGGSKYEGPCSLVGRLESVCVRVRLAVDFTWALDSVDEDGAPDQGCWWRYGQMTSAIYTPLVKADTAISLGGVTFQVRSSDDPYIAAQRLTEGSMYFGKDYSDQQWLGVSFWILGVIALMPCCVFFCVLQRSAKQKRQQVSGRPADPQILIHASDRAHVTNVLQHYSSPAARPPRDQCMACLQVDLLTPRLTSCPLVV